MTPTVTMTQPATPCGGYTRYNNTRAIGAAFQLSDTTVDVCLSRCSDNSACVAIDFVLTGGACWHHLRYVLTGGACWHHLRYVLTGGACWHHLRWKVINV